MDPVDRFGEEIAARYDDDGERFDAAVVARTVDVLADLAAGGPVLEFGIGTGRIALPLAARGVEVHGIDLSPSMVARLRDKPGGDAVPVAIGDFATTRVPGSFSLVVLVFNTIMNLTTQEAQVACVRNAAAHLRPGGAFVVEVLVPALRRLPPGERLVPFRADEDGFGIDEYDVATQAVTSHHVDVVDGRAERVSIPFRYVWPSELDLMAAMAGMGLDSRWADWDRSPFTNESEGHVSVWRLPA